MLPVAASRRARAGKALTQLWNRISQTWGRGKTVSSVTNLFDAIPLADLGSYESYLAAGTKNVWASWRAIDLVGQVVQSTPFTLTRRGKKDPVKVPGLDQLLSYPNECMTYGDLTYLTTAHIKYTGNAYWFKDQATVKGDRPLALWPLNPKRVSIDTGKMTGQGGGRIVAYDYACDGRAPLKFAPQQIIHFKRPHPNNDYYGIGDFEAAEDLIQEVMNRSTWQRQFWKNGAAPSTIMTTEDNSVTSKEDLQVIKNEWLRQYAGHKNAGKTAFMPGKWTVHRLGLSAQEMQELERIKLTTEQIFQLHGVPLSVAGIKDAANFATAQIADRQFRRDTVMPIVRIIQDTQQTDLIDGFGDFELKFNLSGLIDIAGEMEVWAKAFTMGIISGNEFREKLGLAPTENPLHDNYFISAALVPIDLAGVANMDQVDDQAKRIISDFNQKILTPTPQPA